MDAADLKLALRCRQPRASLQDFEFVEIVRQPSLRLGASFRAEGCSDPRKLPRQAWHHGTHDSTQHLGTDPLEGALSVGTPQNSLEFVTITRNYREFLRITRILMNAFELLIMT